MKFNLETHISEHISKKEVGCHCCRKYRFVHVLPIYLEDLRQQVSNDRGYDTPINFHCICRCLHHNRLLGDWYLGDKVLEHADVGRIINRDASSVVSIIVRDDMATFDLIYQNHNILWKPLSKDTSQHVFDDVKETYAADFDMTDCTADYVAAQIHIMMKKYDRNYRIYRYHKWNSPGVHFDVADRGVVVDKVRG